MPLNILGDGFIRPGVNGNFLYHKGHQDYDRKICRAKIDPNGCMYPGNWVQDKDYCHVVTDINKMHDHSHKMLKCLPTTNR